MNYKRRRWGSNDRYFGPFTYAYAKKGDWRPLSIVLFSGGSETHGCGLRLSALGHTLIIALPPIIRPHRVKVFPNWDAETVSRLGRDYYFDETEREYGFTLSDGHLSVYFGRQSHDSSTEQRWGYFLPWREWRFVRYSLYDFQGRIVWTEPPFKKGMSDEERREQWEEETRQKRSVPKQKFKLIDFDGEEIIATVYVEEREWRFGDKWCSWLSWFRKPKVVRALNIEFDKETGHRKGSWKGGTIGAGANLDRYCTGEYQGAMLAMMEYCERKNMKFVGYADESK